MGAPTAPAPTPTSAGCRRLGVGGSASWAGARLLFALHPPPSIWGGGRGAGGSEPASGEGASDGLRALKKGPGTAARPFSVFSGRLPKIP